MKLIILFACWILFGNRLMAQTPADEKAVRLIFNQMHDAWVAHNYPFAGLDIFDENAVVINPVGMYWKNRAEIQKSFKYLGEVRFKYFTTIKDSIMSIRFLSPSSVLVIVKGTDKVSQDFTMPGETIVNKKGEQYEGIRSYTLVKEDSGWKITSIQITEVNKTIVSQKN